MYFSYTYIFFFLNLLVRRKTNDEWHFKCPNLAFPTNVHNLLNWATVADYIFLLDSDSQYETSVNVIFSFFILFIIALEI